MKPLLIKSALLSWLIAGSMPITAAELEPMEIPAGPGSLAPGLATYGGQVVLSWLEQTDDGHALRFSRHYDKAFGPAEEIARGSDWFANWADMPAIFMFDDERWFAHWLEKSADSTYAYDIRLVHSGDAGRSWGPPATPHADGTPTEHGFVSYFSGPEGQAGMAWLDGRETGGASGPHDHAGAMTLRAARLDPADSSSGASELLDDRVCDCCRTASGVAEGRAIVVYRDRDDDEVRDISIVRATDAGWSEPVRVAADGWKVTGCPVNGPAMIADGRQVVVAWFTMAEQNPRVRLARSTDGGRSFDDPVTFSAGTALGRVQLAAMESGFILTWMDQAEPGSARHAVLRMARFDWAGNLMHSEILTMLDGGRISGFPAIAVAADQLIVAWTATIPGPDGRNRPQVRVGRHGLKTDPGG